MNQNEYKEAIDQNPYLLTNLMSLINIYKKLLGCSEEEFGKVMNLFHRGIMDDHILDYMNPVLRLAQRERIKRNSVKSFK